MSACFLISKCSLYRVAGMSVASFLCWLLQDFLLFAKFVFSTPLNMNMNLNLMNTFLIYMFNQNHFNHPVDLMSYVLFLCPSSPKLIHSFLFPYKLQDGYHVYLFVCGWMTTWTAFQAPSKLFSLLWMGIIGKGFNSTSYWSVIDRFWLARDGFFTHHPCALSIHPHTRTWHYPTSQPGSGVQLNLNVCECVRECVCAR